MKVRPGKARWYYKIYTFIIKQKATAVHKEREILRYDHEKSA